MKSVFADPSKLRVPPRMIERSFDALLALIDEHRPRLGLILRDNGTEPWTAADVDEIQKIVFSVATEQRVRIDFLRILNAACLDWLAARRLNIKVVSFPKLLVKKLNPHTRDITQDRSIVGGWKQILDLALDQIAGSKNRNSSEHAEIVFSAFILSSIIYGGLLFKGSLAAVVRAFPILEKVTIVADQRVHVELGLTRYGIVGAELRRWQPDALTATLLFSTPSFVADELRSHFEANDVQQSPSDTEIFQSLSELILNLPLTLNVPCPSNLSVLMHSVASVATFEIGSSLTRYATGEFKSVSMSRQALQRFTREKIAIEEENSHPYITPQRVLQATEWAENLLNKFNCEDRDATKMQIKMLVRDDSGNGQLKRFADFSDFLLRTTALSGRLMPVAKVKKTVQTLIKHLIPQLNGCEPSTIQSTNLDQIYVDTFKSAYAESMSQTSRRRLYNAILEFDRYMSHFCDKIPVSSKLNLYGWRELARVDANPISIAEYERILIRIDADPMATPERRKIGKLLVNLAFRCGLRRLEALLPKIRDFLMLSSKELLVRGHKLKTNQARRKIQLKLLSETELRDLESWISERLGATQGAKRDDYLFGNAKEELAVLPEAIFDWLNDLMREVTQDVTMKFHQLRHSFATYIFMSLMLSDFDVIPNIFHLQHSLAWINDSRARRKMLYQNSQPTRRHLYLIARDLGHLSPETSVNCYIHFFDWLLRIALDRSENLRPESELVYKASQKSQSTLNRWKVHTDGVMLVPINIWCARFPECKPQLNRDEIDSPSKQNHNSRKISLGNSESLLDADWKFYKRQLLEPGKDALNADQQQRMSKFSANVKYLQSLKLPNKAPRHLMQNVKLDKRKPADVQVLELPRRPSGMDDQLLNALRDRLERLRENNQELFYKGLGVFIHRVQENNFVRFASPNKTQDVNDAYIYLQFLEGLEFDHDDLQIISGDRAAKSEWRSLWRKALGLEDCRIKIQKPHSKVYFGSKSALSIRPKKMKSNDSIRGAEFRFTLVMSYAKHGKQSRIQNAS